MKKQTLIIAVVIVLLIAGGWYYLGGGTKEEIPADKTTSTDETTSGLRIGSNAIFVSDQKPGNSVTVGFADIADGGYVVIHEVTDGNPGAIIGNSAFLSSGELQNISVDLLSETEEGKELIAMLHNDNGDGLFNAADDAPVRDENGNIVLMRFTVLENAEASGAISL